MKLPAPRGPLSSALCQALLSRAAMPTAKLVEVAAEEDEALTLWILHELHYRDFDDCPEALEWEPAITTLRGVLEQRFEQVLRTLTADLVDEALSSSTDLAEQLALIAGHHGPTLTRHLHRDATDEQFREFLIQRSVYHLKEADPHAWTLPRLTGTAKVALAELLYDEYGGGIATHLHQRLFADALDQAGLDSDYGRYVDQVPGHVLAFNNAMSMFGLNRRLRGASMGHLAAFEMGSSVPCRRYAQGAERLGLGAAVVRYFDEHVEADAVHEQLAVRSICAALLSDEPALHQDVLFGAAACVLLEEASSGATLAAWTENRSSLLLPVPEAVA